MDSKEKIAYVLNEIKEKSEITPGGKNILYELNFSVSAPYIAAGDDEMLILSKLKNEGFIKLFIPEDYDERGRYSAYSVEEFMDYAHIIGIEITPKFDKHYKAYKKYLKLKTDLDFWKLSNPLWYIKHLYNFLKKHKVSSIIILISTLLSLVAIDYSLAFANLKNIWAFVNKIF